MEMLDYQMMDSILVATLFIVFLMVLFGLYSLFKKVRRLEQQLGFMQATLTDVSNAVKNITVHQAGYNKIIMMKQDDMIQK
jgi:cbb3-type cytochrome oxidase subunit 3